MDTAPRNNTPPRARSAPFGRDFILVVIGQIISLFGNAILRFALPLYLLRQTGFRSVLELTAGGWTERGL